MDIGKALAAEHSKKQTLAIADYIGDDAKRLHTLMDIFAAGDYRLTQRAAWPLMYISKRNPSLLQPWIPFLLQLLNKKMHVAVKRNVLRLLQDIPIPEDQMGLAADCCFACLRSADEPIAVKAFAMTVLMQVCKVYPEMKNELAPIIEDLLPYGSPGIKSRGQKILKALAKL